MMFVGSFEKKVAFMFAFYFLFKNRYQTSSFPKLTTLFFKKNIPFFWVYFFKCPSIPFHFHLLTLATHSSAPFSQEYQCSPSGAAHVPLESHLWWFVMSERIPLLCHWIHGSSFDNCCVTLYRNLHLIFLRRIPLTFGFHIAPGTSFQPFYLLLYYLSLECQNFIIWNSLYALGVTPRLTYDHLKGRYSCTRRRFFNNWYVTFSQNSNFFSLEEYP